MRILTVISAKCLQWVNENCSFERWQWSGFAGSSIACDTRCANAIIEGMLQDGLKLNKDFNII